MIDRSHLRIFREIERQGSLTKAASALHLSQSALSHKVKNLENVMGVSLWSMEGRNIKLTQAGEYLLREAKRLLPQLERIDESLEQYARGEKGRLHIGMECSPCYQWLLKIVNPYLKQWPGVEIDVKQQFQFGGLAALFNYDIDLLVTPDPIQREGIVFQPVFPYEQVLVVAENHPLAAKAYIEPQHLTDQILYTYPVTTDRLDIFQQFLLPAQQQPKRHKTMGSTEMLLQMVVAKRGVTTLPLWLVEEYAQTLAIRGIRLGENGIHKYIHLGFRQSDALERHVQGFMALAMG